MTQPQEPAVCPRCGNARGYVAGTHESGVEVTECASCHTRFASDQPVAEPHQAEPKTPA